ncbi:MAG: ATP-binding protein, partial [Rhodothermia bacterium]
DVVNSFREGRTDRRIDVTTNDELGQLGESFNEMADTIAESIEDLERTDRLRRDLIANVSHDLRSPLAAIQGYLETIMIKHDDLTEEERSKYMEIVLKNTRSLSSLIEELFELSKLDAQQVEPEFEPISVADLVQDVMIQFKPVADKAGVGLDIDMPGRVGLVKADIALVERAISNLIDNAIRYTPSGGDVRIITTENPDAVTVEVVDNGTGIPAEDLPHIFERFYRVEKSRSKDRGRGGLGLAIAKKIIELHGTTLRVSSVVDQGTTFTFSLPKAPQTV